MDKINCEWGIVGADLDDTSLIEARFYTEHNTINEIGNLPIVLMQKSELFKLQDALAMANVCVVLVNKDTEDGEVRMRRIVGREHQKTRIEKLANLWPWYVFGVGVAWCIWKVITNG